MRGSQERKAQTATKMPDMISCQVRMPLPARNRQAQAHSRMLKRAMTLRQAHQVRYVPYSPMSNEHSARKIAACHWNVASRSPGSLTGVPETQDVPKMRSVTDWAMLLRAALPDDALAVARVHVRALQSAYRTL